MFSFIVELLEGGRSDESGESSPGMDDEMRTPCETDVSTLRYTLGSKC